MKIIKLGLHERLDKKRCLYCNRKLKNVRGGRKYCPDCAAWQSGSWIRIIHERDNHTCFYCGEKPKGGEKTIDHIMPVSRCGRNIASNLVTCCMSCNMKKGRRILANIEEIIEIVKLRNSVLNIPNDTVMPISRRDNRGWQIELSYLGKEGGKQ